MPDATGRGTRIAGYPDAHEFFMAVRDAAKDADRLGGIIRGMEAREGLHARGLGPRPRGGARDVMAATDARMDWEWRNSRRMEDDMRLIQAACDILFGKDGTGRNGGVEAVLDWRYSESAWWRFCAAETWAVTAAHVGMSAEWCRKVAVPTVTSLVDSYGEALAVAGRGTAEG